MTLLNRLFPILLLGLLPLTQPALAASDAETRGLAIAQEAERRDAGWRDSQVTATMLLTDRRGQTRERSLRIWMLEKPGDAGDKTLTIFDTPADMKGTIFLAHAVSGGDDNLWLYLPSLKRVKRISSSNKTGAFFGSEFAYEDIAAQEIGKFTYKYLGDRPCGSLTCFVVERRPTYPNSGYSALVTFFDTKEYRVQRIEYLDKGGKPMKVLTLSGYNVYSDRFWRPTTLQMENLKTGKSTVLTYSGYSFGSGLSDGDFDSGRLRDIQ